jgi:outer membrane murein-binding lipoprotein Lpp
MIALCNGDMLILLAAVLASCALRGCHNDARRSHNLDRHLKSATSVRRNNTETSDQDFCHFFDETSSSIIEN